MNASPRMCAVTPRMRDGIRVCVAVCALLFGGCSRWHYLERADHDTYAILGSHTDVDPWSDPTDLTVLPSPESRLFDPTPAEAPLLPDPTPQLHTYAIPLGIGQQPETFEQLPVPGTAHQVSLRRFGQGPPRSWPVMPAAREAEWRILLTRLRLQAEASEADDELVVSPITIPPAAWESIPATCRTRLFEFESLRLEYEKSHGVQPQPDERDGSPRLNFDDVLHLALLNSRGYQSQKEQLYRVALRLTLEQYDYQLKFARFGNRVGADTEIRSSNRQSFRDLHMPSGGRMEALLGTGSDLVTRFANDVLLTFNGPDGFAADVSSEVLFELTHSVFQNDVRFERLTQAERNVVYAARTFARFRRTFYLQLAAQYYNLLRTYRQVEIDGQNYVSLVRVYNQREVEFGQGEVARVQIDQVEQNALDARSGLIGTCNNLENALDRLKILMGLPTETTINLDLHELESLTLGDEVLVNLELVRRVEERLAAELARNGVDEVAALNQAAQLVARMREAVVGQQRMQSASGNGPNAASAHDPTTLGLLQAWLQASEQRLLAGYAWEAYNRATSDADAPAIRIPELAIGYARAVLSLLTAELALAEEAGAMPEQSAAMNDHREAVAAHLDSFSRFVDDVLDHVQLDQLDELRLRGAGLAQDAAEAAETARVTNSSQIAQRGFNFDESRSATLSRLLQQSRELLTGSARGLPPIEIDMDMASLAALAARLDLANARGAMFDEWRGTKLAADDLKSILNLQARQRLVTQNQSSVPTAVDFDESRTELSITIDTPLNRRLQRNAFREQLFNYQASRRSVMALEDAIKQDIRSDLRAIQLAREQHSLGIASAALANERAISTELQLRLGVPGVVARDYLEAQTAYANSLSVVASRHINYILGRITLFNDLEQLQLDSQGRWSALHDPGWTPHLDLAAPHSYGALPDDLHYSTELRDGSHNFWLLGE